MSAKLTLSQLRVYNGEQSDGLVYVALNGRIYDVTEDRCKFGTGGPVTVYAGKDATRGLAKMSLECVDDSCADLSDLSPPEMERLKNWEKKFQDKYKCVGTLEK